jgi:hypothetical protein
MRATHNQQFPLATEAVTPDHPSPRRKSIAQISAILNSKTSIYILARQDFGIADNNIGANGMTVEQVARAVIIQSIGCYMYRELSFHLSNF